MAQTQTTTQCACGTRGTREPHPMDSPFQSRTRVFFTQSAEGPDRCETMFHFCDSCQRFHTDCMTTGAQDAHHC